MRIPHFLASMHLVRVLLYFLLATGHTSALYTTIGKWLEETDREFGMLKQDYSLYTWQVTVGEKPNVTFNLNISMSEWKLTKCAQAKKFHHISSPTIRRAIYLLCRGPLFTKALEVRSTYLQLGFQHMYSAKTICRDNDTCYHIEPELVNLMRESRNPDLLRWAWEAWRAEVAKDTIPAYPMFIEFQNDAAKANGYNDIGECWREELEVDDLEQVMLRLLEQVIPLHKMLHAYVRHKLRQFYGSRFVSATGRIPAHLLGSMWSQSWESLLDIVLNTSINFDEALKKKYTIPLEMAKEAERYYESLGFEPMTDKFWKHSVISKLSPNITCHGTAANMFAQDDYRMLLCASISWDDFYVIHHELGHIQYYMAYSDLPTIFKEAANSAFQEAIGDTIMLTVETPSHLKRLGIFKLEDDIEIPLLLYQALKKIPHIPFAYIVDKWRWGVMASNITVENYNKAWWDLRMTYEGIRPPSPRPPGSFDAISKYHIPDNTPYARNMMSQGATRRWDYLLNEFSNGRYKEMSAMPLLRYFDPLVEWLQERIDDENIPVGW